MVDYITDKGQICNELLTEYVKSADVYFCPPLTGRIDIESWVNKIYINASVVIAEDGGRYIGCIFFYSNDTAEGKGYIAYLVVNSEYRGMGIAKTMLDTCIHISRDAGMRSINVYTYNPGAVALYKSRGFVQVSQVIDDDNLIQTFLIKQL